MTETKCPHGLTGYCRLCDRVRTGRTASSRLTRRRTSLPCVHLGSSLTGFEREARGLDHAKDWHHCNHESQPLGPVVCPCKGCGPGCSGYVADVDTSPAWHHGSAAFLESLPTYPEGRWSGRGVVIAGGGPYWPSVYVTARMLRHVGCTLPVQVWYLGGRGEQDKRYERLLAPFGVTCVDADSHPARDARRIVNGFEVKLFAVINSPFEEVLFLDADNYPCADPTVLFADPRYLKVGGVYWPDLQTTNKWTRWAHWGVQKHGPDCGFEVGQYILHKRLAWKPMMLAEWYDDRSDQCYGHKNKGDHGDKGPHRVAWAKLKRSPAMFNERARLESPAFIHPGPDGWTPMFVHRVRSKFVLGATKFATTPQDGTNQRAELPMEREAFGYLNELRKSLTSLETEPIAVPDPIPSWWARREPTDLDVFATAVVHDEYGLGNSDLSTAAVLDIGAHVGSFSYAAWRRGCRLVHAYEPFTSNFTAIAANARHMPGVTPFHEAIGEPGVTLRAKAEGRNSAGVEFREDGGGDLVTVVGLDTAIGRLASVSSTGRVSILKIDAEGAEWPAFSHATWLDLVDRIVGEWHRKEWRGRDWGPDDLPGLLEPHGFTITLGTRDGLVGLFTATRTPQR